MARTQCLHGVFELPRKFEPFGVYEVTHRLRVGAAGFRPRRVDSLPGRGAARDGRQKDDRDDFSCIHE